LGFADAYVVRPAFFKEGHGDGAQNYMICFEQRQACMILPTNSDNGELAFRALLEKLWGDAVTPWEWEGYTATYIDASRKLKYRVHWNERFLAGA
jgi:hypothetical protein